MACAQDTASPVLDDAMDTVVVMREAVSSTLSALDSVLLAAGAQDDGAVWAVTSPSSQGFAPGVMIAQGNYDDVDQSRLFVLDASKLSIIGIKEFAFQGGLVWEPFNVLDLYCNLYCTVLSLYCTVIGLYCTEVAVACLPFSWRHVLFCTILYCTVIRVYWYCTALRSPWHTPTPSFLT
jgi:hypothetical protein